MTAIDPNELLLAYRLGIFPMAESAKAKDVLWVRPHERGVLPLESFHVPRRLADTVRAGRFKVTVDTAFGDVIRGCAECAKNRKDTWINAQIIEVFEKLHAQGFVHSVECWQNGKLVGGTYGLSLGGAFFAESKFSRARDASKVALVHLAARLKAGRYALLDAQFPNPHLVQFGAIAISEGEFERRLQRALDRKSDFYGFGAAGFASAPGLVEGACGSDDGSSVLQVITHTS